MITPIHSDCGPRGDGRVLPAIGVIGGRVLLSRSGAR